MPIISISCHSVNPHDAQEVYYKAVTCLRPRDLPCIYCDHPITHSHGSYKRQPYTFNGELMLWDIHRRECQNTDCGRTFAILPDILAPYARYLIIIQDMATTHLAEGKSYDQTADFLESYGLAPSESTVRRWYERALNQSEQLLPKLSSILQNQVPERKLPPLRRQVRSPSLCLYYDLLGLLGGIHSGTWNILRLIVCMFAPSVSEDRVSYGLSPG